MYSSAVPPCELKEVKDENPVKVTPSWVSQSCWSADTSEGREIHLINLNLDMISWRKACPRREARAETGQEQGNAGGEEVGVVGGEREEESAPASQPQPEPVRTEEEAIQSRKETGADPPTPRPRTKRMSQSLSQTGSEQNTAITENGEEPFREVVKKKRFKQQVQSSEPALTGRLQAPAGAPVHNAGEENTVEGEPSAVQDSPLAESQSPETVVAGEQEEAAEAAHRYHPRTDLGAAKTSTHCPLKRVPSADHFFSHCRLTMQPPRATASEDNAALGSLQASLQALGQTTGVAGALSDSWITVTGPDNTVDLDLPAVDQSDSNSLLGWAKSKFGAVTSFTELIDPQSITFNAGRGHSQDCELQTNFTQGKYLEYLPVTTSVQVKFCRIPMPLKAKEEVHIIRHLPVDTMTPSAVLVLLIL
ncbi:UNVERIFIED_CONTAM: hypothetical protein FKN15_059263 [Acipenser sinensis]